MNADRLIRIVTLLCMAAIVVLLLYAWLVAIPEQTKLFKQCEEKILCQNKMLTGQACRRYEADTYIDSNFLIIP